MNETELDDATSSAVPPRSAQSTTAKTPHTSEAVSSADALGTLIERAQAGDRSALDAVLSEVRPRALATALKVLRNPDDAQDAVQDAFLKVWRSLGRFEGRSSFTTWIHRIVVNACLDLLRRSSCRPSAADGAAHEDERNDLIALEAADEPSPEETIISRQDGETVHAALALLSPIHRDVLTMREFDEQSYDEIAASAGIPVGTVMSRLHHARKRLADELQLMMPLPSAPALRAAA